MSKQLVLELPEDVYEQLQKVAKSAGQSLEDWAKKRLELSQLSESEKEAKRGKVRRHFGAVDLGYPTGADNEKIDVDLAKESVDTHNHETLEALAEGADDPLLQLAGTLECDVKDVAERHDYYIGTVLMKEPRGKDDG